MYIICPLKHNVDQVNELNKWKEEKDEENSILCWRSVCLLSVWYLWLQFDLYAKDEIYKISMRRI